jgi:putative sterol carrier protein
MYEEPVEFFSKEWCERATELWNTVATPLFVDPDNYNYKLEWRTTDGRVNQMIADHAKAVDWREGKTVPDEEIGFIVEASEENYKKVADGKLDPVGAVAAKRVHLKKGPMAALIKEATAFKTFMEHWGDLNAQWTVD